MSYRPITDVWILARSKVKYYGAFPAGLLHRARALRVGIIDYVWPHPGKLGQEVAVIAVGTGRNNRARWFTVFERVNEVHQ